MEIKEYLHKEERSLAWLARQVGITRSYLADMISGRRALQDKYARAIIKISGGQVTMDDILKTIEDKEFNND